MKNKFEVDEVVIYQKGDRFELGIVKSIVAKEERLALRQDGLFGKPTSDKVRIRYMYFVNYHTGDTAALTNEEDLHKIKNLYAFEIRRKTPEE
ncbi:MAG: hypothetical protein M0Q41_10810 [Bacteroidales bacterium]|nr:hypothetical protein [Acholeplasmataceae bacterium]MCK9449452.1 hypothetical protein [Bacteroidales bacterium]